MSARNIVEKGRTAEDVAAFRQLVRTIRAEHKALEPLPYDRAVKDTESRYDRAMVAVSEIPATTPRGIIAKLSFIQEAMEHGETIWDPDIVASVIEDLERMARAA